MAKNIQDFIPIEEIRDGVLVLKNGTLRSVMMVSTVNFDLKSVDEQTAILSQYQNFLNSLDFSVQLFIQSRKLDIRPYITVLEERRKEQMNELLQHQTREYIEFVKDVTKQTNIMSKSFYIAIPYSPAGFQSNKKGLFRGLFGKKKGGVGSKENLEKFEEHRSQLEQRKAVVRQGLARIGIRTISLGTEELVELFYKIFNPGDLDVPTAPLNTQQQ